MRIFVVVAMAMAVLMAPALAQGKRGGGSHDEPKGKEGPKVDEKAYKAALERIPEPKEKYDPWGGVAPAVATSAKKK